MNSKNQQWFGLLERQVHIRGVLLRENWVFMQQGTIYQC